MSRQKSGNQREESLRRQAESFPPEPQLHYAPPPSLYQSPPTDRACYGWRVPLIEVFLVWAVALNLSLICFGIFVSSHPYCHTYLIFLFAKCIMLRILRRTMKSTLWIRSLLKVAQIYWCLKSEWFLEVNNIEVTCTWDDWQQCIGAPSGLQDYLKAEGKGLKISTCDWE